MKKLLLLAAFAAALFGCGKEKPSAPVETNMPKPPVLLNDGSEDFTKATPDFTLTATQWLDEFEKDSASASKKYNGKVIDVIGQVGTIETEEVNVSNTPKYQINVLLNLAETKKQVRCKTKLSTTWEKAPFECKVVMRGRYSSGRKSLPELTDSVPIRIEGPAPLTITAEDAARLFTQSFQEFAKQYLSKVIFITGEYVSHTIEQNTKFNIVLKNSDGVKVYCVATNTTQDVIAQLQPGKQIKAMGYLTNPDQKTLELFNAYFKVQ